MGREVRMVPKDWQHPIRPSIPRRAADDWPFRASRAAADAADKIEHLREKIRNAKGAAELVAIRKEIDALQRQGPVIDLVPQADGCYGAPRLLSAGFDPNADFIPLHGESWREHDEAWEGEFRLYKQGLWLLPDHDSHTGNPSNWWGAYRIEMLPKEETEAWESMAACADWDERMRARFAEWHGEKGEPTDYMPDWPAEERTHYQMYETCSEGTPISPVMETPEALAQWLADNEASAFGSMTASYESWLAVVHQGCPIGFVIEGSKITSGPAFMARSEN